MQSDYTRRLQSASAPSWVDFIIICIMIGLFYGLLQVLLNMSIKWRMKMKKQIDDMIKLRNETKDGFFKLNGYSWDYVFVFKVFEKNAHLTSQQKEFSLKRILDLLCLGGLENKLFYSLQNDEVYCKVRASAKRLLKEADRINYQFPIDPIMLAQRLKQGNSTGPVVNQWSGFEIPNTTSIDPYEYIYMDYDDERPENTCLLKKRANGTIFRGADRLKLISSILNAPISSGGCSMNIYKLIESQCLLGFYALHDKVELKEVEQKCLRIFQLPWNQNTDYIKDYFGEKIGLFFVWLGHYTTYLISASVVGFFAWIGVAADKNNPNSPVIPYFSVFIAVWCTIFLESWKRKEKYFSMMWGTDKFEEAEVDRLAFFGDPDVSPVTGSPMTYFSEKAFALRVCYSVSVIFVLISIVIAVISSIIVLRIILSFSSDQTLANSSSIIASVINAIQIQVLNMLYADVAIRLTDYENHRTDTQYEDSLIAKTFIFQFVNSFASLFYIAFIKIFLVAVDPCKLSCMSELQTALGTILLTRLVTSSSLQIVLPVINRKRREISESAGADIKDLSDIENQFIQEEYNVILGTFADYSSMVIQFAYVTMFISAFPLATVIAFVNNYVEIRVKIWKLCHLSRRPEPRSSQDIGTWYIILEIISFLSVFVNSGLIAFTGSFAINITWYSRLWIFIGVTVGVLLVKILVSSLIPDISEDVEVQLRRKAYIISKIVNNVQDDSVNFKNDPLLIKDINIRLNDD